MPQERKTYAKSFSVTDQTRMQLQELMAKHDMLSESEAMRRAVSEFHNISFPDYIYKKSAKDIQARAEAEEKKKIEDMSDIEYAQEYIGNQLVVDSEDGHKYILVHGLSNMLSAIRDDEIKNYVAEFPDLVALHQRKSQEYPVAGELSDYMVQLLKRDYKIKIPQEILDPQ